MRQYRSPPIAVANRETTMFQRQITFTYPFPLHMRPTASIVKAAKEFESNITATVNDKSADMKSSFKLLSLGVVPGSVITVTAEGPDEQNAVERVVAVIEDFSAAMA